MDYKLKHLDVQATFPVTIMSATSRAKQVLSSVSTVSDFHHVSNSLMYKCYCDGIIKFTPKDWLSAQANFDQSYWSTMKGDRYQMGDILSFKAFRIISKAREVSFNTNGILSRSVDLAEIMAAVETVIIRLRSCGGDYDIDRFVDVCLHKDPYRFANVHC